MNMKTETLGAHLRNLLTPYKNLLQLVKDGKADEETIRKYNLDNLDELIAFSNSEAMEQEPASEDLEQAAEQAEQREGNLINGRFKAGFKSGAQWQKEQDFNDFTRLRKSWYEEGRIHGQFEGLSDDVKYQQGFHDAKAHLDRSDAEECKECGRS